MYRMRIRLNRISMYLVCLALSMLIIVVVLCRLNIEKKSFSKITDCFFLYIPNVSCHQKLCLWSLRSGDSNSPAQLQSLARVLKFWIEQVQVYFSKYRRLSLSQSPGDQTKYLELSVV